MLERIPIVDIADIGLGAEDPTFQAFQNVGSHLDTAFREIGFVYLANHGLNPGTVSRSMQSSKTFFLQNEEQKTKFKREVNTGDISGWVAQGREFFNEDGQDIFEIRESFDIFSLGDEAKIPETGSREDTLDIYQSLGKEAIDLTSRLLKALSIALGKDIHFLNNLHRNMMKDGNKTSMRTLYYPPIEGTVSPGSIRCGAHTDYGTLTLLFQDEYPGLQVKSALGDGWIDAPPLKGKLMVNIGDLLEMWTEGVYPATVHRVIIPEEELSRKCARQSIVFFVHPDDQVMISPLNEEKLVDSTQSRFVTALEHVQTRFKQTFKY